MGKNKHLPTPRSSSHFTFIYAGLITLMKSGIVSIIVRYIKFQMFCTYIIHFTQNYFQFNFRLRYLIILIELFFRNKTFKQQTYLITNLLIYEFTLSVNSSMKEKLHLFGIYLIKQLLL